MREKKETDRHHSFHPAVHTVAIDKRELLCRFCNGGKSSAKLISFQVLRGESEKSTF